MRLTIFTLSFLLFACVKPKIYRAELSAREASEARESVLIKELGDRKTETAQLTKQVGDLNRTIGNQEKTIADLNRELGQRTQQMGASADRLLSEKNAFEQELAAQKALVAQQAAKIERYKKAQNERERVLNAMMRDLKTLCQDQLNNGARLKIENEQVLLTLPDNSLFDASSLIVSPLGKQVFTPLAAYLASRPALDVDILAYTDNVLPKDKNLRDTWDWSAQRAGNIARLLMKELKVNANQLTPVAKGEFYPLASNETPEGRMANRRTVIVFKPALTPLPTE
jgi:chemotaxis protein MotB